MGGSNTPQTGMQNSNGQPPGQAPAATESVSGVFVANTTFSTEVDGVPTIVSAGSDRVREGHPLLAANPQFFDPVEVGVTFEVERATKEPGEKRGEPTKEELLEKARELDVEGRSHMTKDELSRATKKKG